MTEEDRLRLESVLKKTYGKSLAKKAKEPLKCGGVRKKGEYREDLSLLPTSKPSSGR